MTTDPTMPSPLPGPDPASAVKGPAMFLLIVGGIGILVQVIGLLFNLLGVGLGAAGGREGFGMMMRGGLGIVGSIVGIIVGAVIIMGALKMQKLQSYGLAMTAAVIAMIPCISPCCLLGLPAGIWALIVLMKPEVKAAFNQGAGTGGFPTT